MNLHVLDELELLNNCTLDTPKWSFEGRKVNAKCIKVYDGDTITCVFVPYPHCQPKSFSCRLLGYNSAEIKTTDPNEKLAGLRARDYLRSLVLNKIVTLELGTFDKYGRILTHVYLPSGFHINADMLKSGYGQPYDGTGPKNY